MLTLERFEHELVKLKSQFPADYVGPRLTLKNNYGRCCILGQVMTNLGLTQQVMDKPDYPSWSKWDEAVGDDPLVKWLSIDAQRSAFAATVTAAAELNNAGWKWHDIIDTLIPQTSDAWKQLAQQEAPLVEA